MAQLSALRAHTAIELGGMIAARAISARELIDETFREIERWEPDLCALITPIHDEALAAARSGDKANDGALPPLFGLPFTVKDTIEVAGFPATAGSRLMLDYVPTATATVVERLTRAGAILIGKSNCAEFGIGNLETWSTVRGQTHNPWSVRHSPGGSSGGDAAAVASGMSSFGVGTDYGGSIRLPAHFTGLAGLRPTPGRLPGDGMLPQQSYAPPPVPPSMVQRALQVPGLLARSVKDLELLFAVTANGRRPAAPPTRCAWFVDDVDADVARVVSDAARAFSEAGLEVRRTEPVDVSAAAGLLAELRNAEGFPEIAWLSRDRADLLSPLVRDLLEREARPARRALADDVAAMRVQMDTFLATWGVLLMPVATSAAFLIAAEEQPDRSRLDLCTRMVTLMRLPAVVVPCGTSSEGLPIGVQIVAREGHDEEALAAARILERAFGRWAPSAETTR